jgi:hypothetical protein
MAFSDPDVVSRLELTREQRSKIRGIQVTSRNGRGPGGPGGPGGGIVDDTKPVREIASLLTPAQVATWNALTGAPIDMTSLPRDRPGFGHGPHDEPPSRRGD